MTSSLSEEVFRDKYESANKLLIVIFTDHAKENLNHATSKGDLINVQNAK